MKLSKWITGAAFLLSTQIASVHGADYAGPGYDYTGSGYGSHCDPCDPCYNNPCDLCDMDFCDVEYDVYIDALYWGLCRSNLNAFNVSNGENGHECHHLEPDHYWGWRIGGMARWKCWDVGLRYTSWCFNEKRRFGQDEGENRIKMKFDYDVLDVEVGYACCLSCGMTFRPFVGAKIAWIDDDFFIRNGEPEFEVAKIDFDGHGLYIGASTRWELFSFCACERNIPFALVARASSGVLRGEFDRRIQNGLFDKLCHKNYIPVHDFYVALDMTFCDICGCEAFFQVGYEAQYWGWHQYASPDDLAHLGLGGLVLRFGASF